MMPVTLVRLACSPIHPMRTWMMPVTLVKLACSPIHPDANVDDALSEKGSEDLV